MLEITSTENQIIKHIRKLSAHTYRKRCGETVLEGERLVNDCMRYGGKINAVLLREDYKGSVPACEKIYKTTAKIFDAFSETTTPQGILAIASVTMKNAKEIARGGLVVVCDRVQDPGNLGTILRTAHAVGADGVILLKGSADPFSLKTVRASMGSCFAISVGEADEMPSFEGYTSFCGTLSDKTVSLYETVFPKKTLLVLGNEANGASEDVIASCEKHIRIPMPGGAESLNVAAAGAVMMYEYHRQVEYV